MASLRRHRLETSAVLAAIAVASTVLVVWPHHASDAADAEAAAASRVAPVRNVGVLPAGMPEPATKAAAATTTTATTAPPVRFRSIRRRWSTLRPRPTVAPTAIAIPAIGVRARIVQVGVDPRTRQLALPPDAATVVWYRQGPAPGGAGSAVLAAHVDYGGAPGAFFRLRELGPGDTVTVTLSGGVRRMFTVVARRAYDKPQLPLAAVFRPRGKPVLTLVTCGGAFQPRLHHYAQNVVIYAVPRPRSS